MSTNDLLPKFLSVKVAKDALQFIAFQVDNHVVPFNQIKRSQLHIVILVPEMLLGEYPDYMIQPKVLVERSIGKQAWERDYKDIARCKAIQMWHGRSDGGCEIQPHLLYQGDAPYYGAVARQGIVVACSGVEPYFDRMISSMVADICIAMARHLWENSEDKSQGVETLS